MTLLLLCGGRRKRPDRPRNTLNNGKKNMKSASQYGFSPEQKH
ncbi:MAG: hypothetical protein K2O16_05890 [Lachnospiraceae bacterium]|nr:hypothetical protein [Lachnospiraceae bacterium]